MRGLVVTVLEPTAEAAERALASMPAEADLVEIRADLLRAGEVAGLVRRAPRPAIVTVRTPDDGGRFSGSVEEKRAVLDAALAAGTAFVDVEWTGPLRALALGPAAPRVVLSHHGAGCDAALRPLFDAMADTKAARLKIVPRVSRASEIGALRALLEHARTRGRMLAAFGLGPAALASRVLALAWGSWGTYASASRETAAGDGQRPAREMIDVYRCGAIGGATVRHALVGSPVAASPSPALHAAGYAALGLDAIYLPVETSDAGEVPALAELLGLSGLAVTVPLKEAVAARCARLDAYAACGAANTVRLAGGAWEGSNTDAPAALALIAGSVGLRGARVAVHGAGGTARAIGAALAARGARVEIYARDPERAARTAAAIGASAGASGLAEARWDVLVQATPLGRDGDEVLPASALRGRAVLDCAYGPRETPLVRAARAAGLAVWDGYDLLYEQAVRQFAILTGRPAPREAIRAALAPHRPPSGA